MDISGDLGDQPSPRTVREPPLRSRSYSSVDGHTSMQSSASHNNMPGQYPNSSAPTTPNAGAGRTLTAKRSVRLLDPQGGPAHTTTSSIATLSQVYDPPRAARQGYEWVWFPAGYWAEREIVEVSSVRKPESGTWPFRWHRRSAKENSGGGGTQDSTDGSPQTTIDNPLSPSVPTGRPRQVPPLASPYLSEAAHVQSLQRPSLYSTRQSSSDSESSFEGAGATSNKPKSPLPTPWLGAPSGEEPHTQLHQRRSYFHFGGSGEDSMASPTATSSNRLSVPTSLSPKTTDAAAARLRPIRARPSLRPRGPSSESFASAAMGNSGESASKVFASSPLKTSKEMEDDMQLRLQTQATDGTRRESQSVESFNEAKPKYSFIKRLLWETKPKPKKAQAKPGVDLGTVATIVEEAKPQPHVNTTQPQVTITRFSSSSRDEEKNPASKPRPRRLFGKGPWYRRASAGSSASASSTVPDALRGWTPGVTPSKEVESYSQPCDLYPGGEARRLKTPPFRETKAGPRLNGFFFDISTPSGNSNDTKRRRLRLLQQKRQTRSGDSSRYRDGLPYGAELQNGRHPTSSSNRSYPNTTTTTSPEHQTQPGGKGNMNSSSSRGPTAGPMRALRRSRESSIIIISPALSRQGTGGGGGGHQNQSRSRSRSQSQSPKDWWKAPVPDVSYEDMAPAAFEFDLPEHLPNSPMCPANKKHRSGGTGVCVYHGRRKMSTGGDGGGDGEGDRGGDPDDRGRRRSVRRDSMDLWT